MIQAKLSEIRQVVADDLEKFDERLAFHTSSGSDFIDQLIRHVVEGGKRIRPLLLLLSAKSAGQYDSVAPDLAVVVELIHVASLLHDDVLDQAELRRGRETIHSRWSIKTAVLLGDFLNAKALEVLSSHADSFVISIISDAVQAMCKGEILHTVQVEQITGPKSEIRNQLMDEETYIEVVTMKTGKMIAASCLTGAYIAHSQATVRRNFDVQHSPYLEAYRKYGLNLGVAFQLADDLLDLHGEKDQLGKLPFNDLREGKFSYPYIDLKNRCSENEFAKLEHIMINSYVDEEISWIINLVEKYGVKKRCADVAKKYAKRAKSTLSSLPDSDAKNALLRLADYAVLRDR